ncbi:MAG: RusA family crossover junction endodeoxyribonuclease [Planctomycetes bacterium]|nr:RusA family crossover junction endodeoxyribonuclease [Planctomycetota bacterium]
MSLELPYPPSINHYWRHVGRRVLISQAGREYRAKVVRELAALRVETLSGPLCVELGVCPPDNRDRDLDNILKALFDSLTKGQFWQDDKQVRRLVVDWYDPTPDDAGAVTVTASPLERKARR